jgi:uncharacterized protein (TIGR02300 family)
MSNKTARGTTERGTKRTCQNEECGARFYDLNRQPIVCPICNAIYALVPATTVRAYQGPAKRRVVEPDHAELDVAADGDARSQMEAEEEPAAGDDDVALIEDIEEDSADVSEIIDTPSEPEETP